MFMCVQDLLRIFSVIIHGASTRKLLRRASLIHSITIPSTVEIFSDGGVIKIKAPLGVRSVPCVLFEHRLFRSVD